MDTDFMDDSHFDSHDPHSSSENPGDAGNSGHQQPGSANGSTNYEAAPNGTYQYAPSPAPPQQPSGQQQQQAPPQGPTQHQFQAQPQPQPNYAQQNPDMYHNQTTFSAVNVNNGQGQHGQMPQAPIGSPMPPMSSMGQYMTGYPSSVPQHGMDGRYPHPGDPNKMLSSARHKKEVKRRTKTGCLTCRKRRIKVCAVLSFGCARGARSRLCPHPAIVYFISRLNPRPRSSFFFFFCARFSRLFTNQFQCDEGHPVCRNCVKSKRECLGYDPVFRPSASTPIQPAPNPPPSLVVNPQGPPPSSSAPAYPSAPPGYMPASSQPFAPSLPSESPSASTDQPEHRASLEPSLTSNNTPTMQASVDPLPQSSEPSYKGACEPLSVTTRPELSFTRLETIEREQSLLTSFSQQRRISTSMTCLL